MRTHTGRAVLFLSLAMIGLIAGGSSLPSSPQAAVCAIPEPAASGAACSSSAQALSSAAPGSCTIFTAVQGETVLFGNNEDWITTETRYWAIPSRPGRYGGVFFGFDNLYPQGGVNEMGLAYDVNSTPPDPLTPHPERPPLPDRFGEHMLERSATVEEAIALAMTYSWGDSLSGQIHLADASGDAAVISAGSDGELAFTRKAQGDGFLVSTNFNPAGRSASQAQCWRYDTATAMLSQLDSGADLTIEFARDVLDATHQESAETNTVYSNIYDLSSGTIYLYHWYQFDEVVTLDVEHEISAGTSPTPIQDLFSQQTVEQASQAYRAHLRPITVGNATAWAWLGATGLSLLLVLWDVTRRAGRSWRMALIRVLVVLFLGPLGLAADFLVYRRSGAKAVSPSRAAKWRSAVGSALYSASGYALAWLLGLLYFIFYLPNPTPGQVLLVSFGLPPLVGMLILRTPLVSARWGSGYWRSLGRLILPEFASASMAFAGMFPILFLIDNIWFPGPFDVADPRFWLLISLTAIAGALPVLLLNLWTVRRGLDGLPVRLLSGGETTEQAGVVMPSLRNAWPEALLGLMAALASLALTVPHLG